MSKKNKNMNTGAPMRDPLDEILRQASRQVYNVGNADEEDYGYDPYENNYNPAYNPYSQINADPYIGGSMNDVGQPYNMYEDPKAVNQQYRRPEQAELNRQSALEAIFDDEDDEEEDDNDTMYVEDLDQQPTLQQYVADIEDIDDVDDLEYDDEIEIVSHPEAPVSRMNGAGPACSLDIYTFQELGRMVIDDHIAPVSCHMEALVMGALEDIEEESLFSMGIDESGVPDATILSCTIDNVNLYITTRKHPSAVYYNNEFLEKYNNIAEVDTNRFSFVSFVDPNSSKNYVFGYYVPQESMDSLWSFVAQASAKLAADEDFLPDYRDNISVDTLGQYATLAILCEIAKMLRVMHMAFIPEYTGYLEAYKTLAMNKIFEQTIQSDATTTFTDVAQNEAALVYAFNITDFMDITVTVMNELSSCFGEDDDDEEDDEDTEEEPVEPYIQPGNAKMVASSLSSIDDLREEDWSELGEQIKDYAESKTDYTQVLKDVQQNNIIVETTNDAYGAYMDAINNSETPEKKPMDFETFAENVAVVSGPSDVVSEPEEEPAKPVEETKSEEPIISVGPSGGGRSTIASNQNVVNDMASKLAAAGYNPSTTVATDKPLVRFRKNPPTD